MKVYVGNVAKDLTDAQFTALVEPFGKAESVNLVKYKGTGASRGFGFVEFKNDEEARAAIAALNGKEINGQKLTVNESQPKGGTRLKDGR